MQTIFLINDESPTAANAAVFAWNLARITKAKIVLGVYKMPLSKSLMRRTGALITTGRQMEESERGEQSLLSQLTQLNETSETFTCNIEQLDIRGMQVNDLARFINQSNSLMIIKAAHDGEQGALKAQDTLNIRALFNAVNVPVCMVPAGWQPRPLQSVAYLTDLRYCRTDVLSHLMKCTSPETAIYIAHMAIDGVADLGLEYANDLLMRLTQGRKKSRLFLHHIKESHSVKVADVLVNSMKNDALALTNRSAHFHKLIGGNLTIRHPGLIQVPLLVYPA